MTAAAVISFEETRQSFAKDVGARAFCDRIIPAQQDGARGYHIIQQKGQLQAGKLPGRPASV